MLFLYLEQPVVKSVKSHSFSKGMQSRRGKREKEGKGSTHSKDIVILAPKRKEPPLNPMIKHKIHKRPAAIINPRSRRHVISAHENKWPVDILPKLLLRPLVQIPRHDRHEGADPEEVKKRGVDFADAVETGWSDEAPDHGRGKDSAAVGAGEAVGLVGAADVGDVAEHPEGYAALRESAEEGCDALGEEDEAWGNLEVVG